MSDEKSTPEKDGERAAALIQKALKEANEILYPHGCQLLVSVGFQVLEKAKENQTLAEKS